MRDLDGATRTNECLTARVDMSNYGAGRFNSDSKTVLWGTTGQGEWSSRDVVRIPRKLDQLQAGRRSETSSAIASRSTLCPLAAARLLGLVSDKRPSFLDHYSVDVQVR